MIDEIDVVDNEILDDEVILEVLDEVDDIVALEVEHQVKTIDEPDDVDFIAIYLESDIGMHLDEVDEVHILMLEFADDELEVDEKVNDETQLLVEVDEVEDDIVIISHMI